MGSGRDALAALEQNKPRFHPDPAAVVGALENQFTGGPKEVAGAGGASYAIGNAVLHYLADLPASDWTSIESGCGYTTVVLAAAFGTHVCVNPDVGSNRLVGEFVRRHVGSTGLRHLETSSDRGLPGLAAEGLHVELALIDGNHSHPFPILDFHYMDQMLVPGGRLLIDNTEIDAVQELTDYLDLEPAYALEQLIGNCAVYRKVREREFGWKSQVLRRTPNDSEAARRELARLRMEIAPDLRQALSGAYIPDPVEAPRQTAAGVTSSAAATSSSTRRPASTIAVAPAPRPERSARALARWYRSTSGALAAAALVLMAIGFVTDGAWRLTGVAGVLFLGLFLPYKFLREQQRTVTSARAAVQDELRRPRRA